MTKRINRPEYIQKLIEFKDTDVVKIVTGIRRCGKSTLLDLFKDYLLEQSIPAQNITHMNMESLKYSSLLDYEAFYHYVSDRIAVGQRNYLIFDELQMVEHWEKAIESFRLDFDVDIYITGSNAYLLSSEFSTLLSGRYVEIRLMPLSFKEFLDFYPFPRMLQQTISSSGICKLEGCRSCDNLILIFPVSTKHWKVFIPPLSSGIFWSVTKQLIRHF